MIKLDLSKFKHDSSDDKSTTLRHKDGHTITLAHKSLTPDVQKQLQALAPVQQPIIKNKQNANALNKIPQQDQTDIQSDASKHQSDQKMANGGLTKEKGVLPQASGSPQGQSARGYLIRKANESSEPKEKSDTIQYAKNLTGSLVNDIKKTNPNIKGLAKGGEISPDPQKFADKGIVEDDPIEVDQDQAPATNEVEPQDQPNEDTPQSPDAAADIANELNDAKIAPDDSQSSQPQAAQSSQQPDLELDETPAEQPQQQIPQPSPQTIPQATPQTSSPAPKSFAQNVQDIKQDTLKTGQDWQHDLDNGHITPKTYQDLFHYNSDGTQKSTLGKIGMAFGMLLSGMGSGLAHQPNAMMEIMNNQIKNDLDAQQNSRSNALNYMKLNQQDALNKAQVGLIGGHTQLTQQQAAGAYWDAYAKSFHMSQISATHDLARQISDPSSPNFIPETLPNGLPNPKRQQAEQTLAYMNQYIQSGEGDIKDKATVAAAAAKTFFGPQAGQPGLQTGQDQEAIFQNRMRGMQMMGPQTAAMAADQESHHMPGYSDRSSRPVDGKDREQVLAHDRMNQSITQLQNFVSAHGGAWDRMLPVNRVKAAQLVLPIQAGFRENTLGTVYREGEQPLLDKAIQGQPLSALQYFLKTEPAKLDQLKTTNQLQKNILLKNSLGIDPKSAYPQSAQSNSPQSNIQQTNAPKEGDAGVQRSTGKPIIFKNGVWIYR